MKKIFTLLMAVAMFAVVGCGGGDGGEKVKKTDTKGVSKPENTDDEEKADPTKKGGTAAGGEAKAATAPD